jgi:hypothetical protein
VWCVCLCGLYNYTCVNIVRWWVWIQPSNYNHPVCMCMYVYVHLQLRVCVCVHACACACLCVCVTCCVPGVRLACVVGIRRAHVWCGCCGPGERLRLFSGRACLGHCTAVVPWTGRPVERQSTRSCEHLCVYSVWGVVYIERCVMQLHRQSTECFKCVLDVSMCVPRLALCLCVDSICDRGDRGVYIYREKGKFLQICVSGLLQLVM